MSKRRKVKRPKLGHMIYVEMDDIEHKSGWRPFADISKRRASTFHAVGWVVRASKRTLTISSVVDSFKPDAYGYCDYMIPMRSVTRIAKLK